MKPALLTDDMTALPSNAEFDLVNRYTSGRMTEAEAEAFEKDLDDPAFFYRVAPLIKLWYTREPLPIEVEIGNRIEARRAAGLPLYEPSLRESVGDTIERIPIRGVGLAAAATLAFVLVLSGRHAAVAPTPEAHIAQVPVDSALPAPEQPTNERPARTSVRNSPTVIASATPGIAVDTVAAQLPAPADTALERALSELLGSPPSIQSGAATRAESVTVALRIPAVPLAKGKLPISLAQQVKNAAAIAPRLVGQALTAGANAIRARVHKPHS